ncbi:MAG: Xaa-Pro peptidase family protein [Balneolaceae bacterium]
MNEIVSIPESEYKERVQRAAELVRKNDLDLLLVNSNESDFSNARYFSGYWPLFETAGVAINKSGDAVLIIGPESQAFAEDVSRIKSIFPLTEYRESADPSYPELQTSSYRDVFSALGVHKDRPRVGIGGYLVTTAVMIDGLREAFPGAELIQADHIMTELRARKSKSELACMREGYRITEIALDRVIAKIEPGMTELELVGIAQKAIYENGAEYEGLPMYIFGEKSTRHAISRSSHRRIGNGDLVQLNLSARVDGYSPSIGMPISLGPLNDEKRKVVEFGLKAHNWTIEHLGPGEKASQVAQEYKEFFRVNGMGENYLYGPCHGTGMIEVERPWMETDSDYELEEGMTFQVDTFTSEATFGVRWETGVVITSDGCEILSTPLGKIHELER